MKRPPAPLRSVFYWRMKGYSVRIGPRFKSIPELRRKSRSQKPRALSRALHRAFMMRLYGALFVRECPF